MQFLKDNNPENLKKVSFWIVDLLRNKLCNDEGLLIQGIANGKKINNLIIDDFGDVAPFIAMYGGEDVCLRHIEYISKHYKDLGFNKAFAYTDLILGLIWYGRIGKYKEKAKDLAIKLAAEVGEKWMSNEGKLRSVSIAGFKLPFSYGIDSTFIEVWTELYRDTNQQSYADLAEKTFRYFSSLRVATKEGVIPARYSSSILFYPLQLRKPAKFSEVHVMKDNTNYLFGLLDMVRLDICKDEVKESFDFVYSALSERSNKNELNNHLTLGKSSDLLSSFAFIDLSCDAYKVFKEDRYLNTAIVLADYWLSLPSSKTGLFPSNFNTKESYFDSETDMAVAFLKLYECTKEEKYIIKVGELLEGILNHHMTSDGFLLSVDIEDGSVISDSIKTKFVALFIKLLHLCSVDTKIYEDQTLFMLAKDR